MYEQSHRDYLRSGYLHHRLPVMGCYYRDNAITYKAQRDKNARELKLANAAHIDTCRCVSVMLLRSTQIHRRADAKAENDALCDDCWSSSVAHQSSLSASVREFHHRLRWIMQPPPDWQDTAELFHPQRG